MDEKKDSNSPSIPSNFVTIVQLRERWLKENERQQKIKEGEEDRKQKLKEEQDREEKHRKQKHREEQERQRKIREEKRILVTERNGAGSRFLNRSRVGFRTINRNDSENSGSSARENCEKNPKPEIEAPDKKPDMEITDKSKKKKGYNKKRIQNTEWKKNEEAGVTEPAPLEAKKDVESVKAREIDEKWENVSGSEPNLTTEVQQKLGVLSVKCEKEKFSRFRNVPNRYHDRRRAFGVRHSYRSFGRNERRNPRGEGMVWVRKDGVSDA